MRNPRDKKQKRSPKAKGGRAAARLRQFEQQRRDEGGDKNKKGGSGDKK